jgi:hypothetical protein
VIAIACGIGALDEQSWPLHAVVERLSCIGFAGIANASSLEEKH